MELFSNGPPQKQGMIQISPLKLEGHAVKFHTGLVIKIDRAGEDQQQFPRPLSLSHQLVCVPSALHFVTSSRRCYSMPSQLQSCFPLA
jgi:hypothetical protein